MDIGRILVEKCAAFRQAPEYAPPDETGAGVRAFAAYLWRVVTEEGPGPELVQACAALEAAAFAAGDDAVAMLAPVFEKAHEQRIAGQELEYDRLRQKLGEHTFNALQSWLETQGPHIPQGEEEPWRKD